MQQHSSTVGSELSLRQKDGTTEGDGLVVMFCRGIREVPDSTFWPDYRNPLTVPRDFKQSVQINVSVGPSVMPSSLPYLCAFYDHFPMSFDAA